MENFIKISIFCLVFIWGRPFVLIYSSEMDLVHIFLLDHTDH